MDNRTTPMVKRTTRTKVFTTGIADRKMTSTLGGSLTARTEYAHLVQFLGNLEGGPSVLQAFQVHLQRELDEGRYPFPVLNDDAHEAFLNP